MDRVCTKIVDTDGGECQSYTGNYSNFLKQKKARLEAWQKAFDNQQKKIQVPSGGGREGGGGRGG